MRCAASTASVEPSDLSPRGAKPGGGPTHMGPPLPGPVTLGPIIGWFKTMTINRYIDGVKHGAWPSFNKRLWQRSFYDHIIRDELELWILRPNIVDNFSRWRQSPFPL